MGGKEFGYPVFSESGTEYEMKKVRYNFDTRKAFINNVITQQGEGGHIVANDAKMNADNSFYMRNANIPPVTIMIIHTLSEPV